MYFQIAANKMKKHEEQRKKQLLTYVLRMLIVNLLCSSLPIIIANIIFLSNLGSTALGDDLSNMWILESVLTFTSAVWDVLDRRNTVLGLRSQIKAAAGPISPIFMVAFFNPVVNIVEEVVINVAITVKILPIEERIMRDEYRQIVMDQGLRPQSNNMNDLVDQVSVLVKKSPNEVFSLGTTNILPVLCNHHEKMVRVIEEKLPPQEKNFAYSEIFGNPSLGSWFSDKDCTIDNGEITGIALMKTEYPTDLHCIGFVYGLNGTCNGPRKGP